MRNITGSWMQGNYRNDYTSGSVYQTGAQGGPCAHKSDSRLLAYLDTSRQVPIANEIRPVNMAVSILIKAYD